MTLCQNYSRETGNGYWHVPINVKSLGAVKRWCVNCFPGTTAKSPYVHHASMTRRFPNKAVPIKIKDPFD